MTDWGAGFVINKVLGRRFVRDKQLSPRVSEPEERSAVRAKVTFASIVLFTLPLGRYIRYQFLRYARRFLTLFRFTFGNCEVRKYTVRKARKYRDAWAVLDDRTKEEARLDIVSFNCGFS